MRLRIVDLQATIAAQKARIEELVQENEALRQEHKDVRVILVAINEVVEERNLRDALPANACGEAHG
jgi:regulator of replication initiation timing